jgi:hypothetical protein
MTNIAPIWSRHHAGSMNCLICLGAVFAVASCVLTATAQLGVVNQIGPEADRAAVAATVDRHLKSAGQQIRQLVFDGDDTTYFESETKPSTADHFTLAFDSSVVVERIEVITGKPDRGERLESGLLEASHDGKTFHEVGRFHDGVAEARPGAKPISAIRITPTAEVKHALVIREIKIESKPPVAVFKYPVEIAIDVSDAPQLKPWAEKTARTCEAAYPMINEELKSDGFTPARQIAMVLKKNYRGVAATSNDRIVGSVDYFQRHQDDVGAMVHETVHVVQHYPARKNSEPGKLGRINAAKAHYNGSYRVSAAFLAYVSAQYDKQVVQKLNAACRQGKYQDEMFKQLTGKTLPELDEEWRGSLRSRK